MRKPNFFIAGAPKCGTTAMHAYLSTHPQVYLSEPKEPHYWSMDIGNGQIKDLDRYMGLFSGATDAYRIVGEATPFYLYSDVALPKIREFSPEAKILVMLRDPVTQAYAFHNQIRYNANENVDDFETAWRLQGVRAKGERIPPKCEGPKLLQYKALASYGEQIDRMWKIFPKQQTMVLFFEDFVADTRRCYLEVEQFLGIVDDGRKDFPVINVSKAHLLPGLGRFLCRPPKALLAINNAVKKVLGLERTNFKEILGVKRKRPPMPEPLEQELREVFAEDVRKLEILLQRDLTHWRTGEKDPAS